MLAAERRNDIIEKLRKEKRVLVSELSRTYQVSEETIRRDLEKLEKEGVATKSYGGATINEDLNIDLPFNERKKQNTQGKHKMGESVAALIHDGEKLFLDASTTSVFVAKALKSKEDLTIITNSIEILIELSDMSGWNVIGTGGCLDGRYLALLGGKTEEAIRTYYVDRAIVSCKALDFQRGMMDSQDLFSSCKRAMLQSARQKILVADNTKFDQSSFTRIGDVGDMDLVITDEAPSPKWLKYFEEAGVECRY